MVEWAPNLTWKFTVSRRSSTQKLWYTKNIFYPLDHQNLTNVLERIRIILTSVRIGRILSKLNAMTFGRSFLKDGLCSCTINSNIFKNLRNKEITKNAIKKEFAIKINICYKKSSSIIMKMASVCWSQQHF